MVDEALILRKLGELEEYLGQIKEYENVTVERYEEDWKTQRIIERTLQMMIETCADICAHIISDKNYRIPTSYADTFKVLEENEIIHPHLLEKLSKMAKFRNVIVHQYDRVNAEIVVGILRRNIGDFAEFKKSIVNFLKSERKK